MDYKASLICYLCKQLINDLKYVLVCLIGIKTMKKTFFKSIETTFATNNTC